MATFTLTPQGPFSLRELALFGFGYRHDDAFDGTMRMAFVTDDYAHQAAVAVTQVGSTVQVEVSGAGDHGGPGNHGGADEQAVLAQVARVLSLDHDGRVFAEIGRRDPVIGRLQQAAPGLRPPQFYSAYDAAAWAVLSARRPAQQMAEVRRRLSETHGATFSVGGRTVAAFPTPAQLLEVTEFDGLNGQKLDRLHAIASAALSGELDTAALAREDPDAAMARMRQLPGIGPFYAALIVIRGCGRADVLPDNEPRSLDIAGRLYGFGRPVTPDELRELARNWQPMPTWALVLIRAAGHRI